MSTKKEEENIKKVEVFEGDIDSDYEYENLTMEDRIINIEKKVKTVANISEYISSKSFKKLSSNGTSIKSIHWNKNLLNKDFLYNFTLYGFPTISS